MGRGLITVVLIFVVMGLFIWGAVQNHRNPNAQESFVWPVVVVTFIFFVTIFVATLLPH